MVQWGGGGRKDVCTVYVGGSTERKREEGCVQLFVIILYEEDERGRLCAAMCDYTV